MGIALNLLQDVRWRGRPVAGDRPRALLAALAARDCRPVRSEELIELVWGDDIPGNGMKSLQVLVARARNICGPDAIVRDGAGYRLGAVPAEVDSGRLAELVRAAATALDQDAVAATDLARGRTGAHSEALPVLEAAYDAQPHDEALLADLLRSEAAVRGPAAALDRFESYRRDLRERLGSDPGEALQRAHRGLLSLDRPVRRGVRYDATPLIGRDADLERLRALVATSRVVSIIGPGGLGKTRLAHALARDAAEPAVHVVELVGVTAGEDVAAEVGSALGVRDSLSDRRVLTPAQRADARAARRRPRAHRPAAPADPVPPRPGQLRAPGRGDRRARGVPDRHRARLARAHHQPRPARHRRRARLPARRAEHGRRRPALPRARCRRAAGRAPARAGRGEHRRLPGRPAAGDRARRGPGARHVPGGDRPVPRRPVRAPARRRPQRAGPAPDPARRHRVVVEPSGRRRAAGAVPAGPVPRRVHPRRGGNGARPGGRPPGRGDPRKPRRGRDRAGPRQPVPGRRARDAGRAALPDAGDGARVRPPAARGRG